MSVLGLRDEHKKPFFDYYGHLPVEFLPLDVMEGPSDIPNGEWTRWEAWREHLCKTFPRRRIPPKLRLKPGMSFQPPRFLFGWAMVSNRMAHDVVRRSRPNSDAPLPYTNYQGESVILTESLRSRFPLIMDQLGWVIIDCVWIHGKGAFTCIALADSWATGSRKPTADQIVTLRDFFGIGKGDIQALDNEPMWWMDLNSQNWEYARRRDYLSDYRPWDLKRRVPVPA